MAPLRVAFWLGIGDCHWACQKLRGLSAYHDGRPIEVHIGCSPNHASVGYLELVPFIERAVLDDTAPYDPWHDLLPSHRDPRYSTLEGCAGWRGFDYVLIANGHLERGERIETWLPELPTDYTYDLRIPEEARTSVRARVGTRRVLLYLSGEDANRDFHNNTWTVNDWMEVIRALNRAGHEPVVVGADTRSDHEYVQRLCRARDASPLTTDFVNLVGQTTIPEYCALIEDAAVWMGLNSGGGVVSAMRSTPTVMFWSDDRYPQVVDPGNWTLPLHHAMQTSWLSPEQRTTYRTFSYGSPKLTPSRVTDALLEVVRC